MSANKHSSFSAKSSNVTLISLFMGGLSSSTGFLVLPLPRPNTLFPAAPVFGLGGLADVIGGLAPGWELGGMLDIDTAACLLLTLASAALSESCC